MVTDSELPLLSKVQSWLFFPWIAFHVMVLHEGVELFFKNSLKI